MGPSCVQGLPNTEKPISNKVTEAVWWNRLRPTVVVCGSTLARVAVFRLRLHRRYKKTELQSEGDDQTRDEKMLLKKRGQTQKRWEAEGVQLQLLEVPGPGPGPGDQGAATRGAGGRRGDRAVLT